MKNHTINETSINETASSPIQTASIIGMGALGLLYADQIAARLGTGAVSFLADEDRVKRYAAMEFTVNQRPRRFEVTASKDAVPADLLIVAVKYNALEEALDTMANAVGPDTTIISVLNGITSEAILGRRFGRDKVLCSIAQGMDAVKFGPELTYSRMGELRIGTLVEGQEQRLASLAEYLDKAGIAYTEEDNVIHRLWGKFMLNVGVNQTCMAYETTYAGVVAPGEARDTMISAMKEVMALSQAEGIGLTRQDMDDYLDLLTTLSPSGMPSMRQDGLSKRISEVEMFAGTVISMAGKHGLSVPVNERLYRKIKAMEAAYPGK